MGNNVFYTVMYVHVSRVHKLMYVLSCFDMSILFMATFLRGATCSDQHARHCSLLQSS